MSSEVRPELPTASVGSSQAPTAAVDNSAPFSNRPQSTYKSGKAVQTNGATSITFAEDETFDIGMDTRTGVALIEYRYEPPFKFTGSIDRLHFKLLPEPAAAR
jgi:hypothetical protein